MNASMLLLLLVLILPSCHGKVQNVSPASTILPTTMQQKKGEAPLKVTCPYSGDIEPCECTELTGTGLSMDCSKVQDEEELRKVFSAFFPTTEFYEFKMSHYEGVKTLEDGVFGDVSFKSFDMFVGDLDTVETDALTPSLSTLTHFCIQYSNLETFPFERLAEFTSLQYLSFSGNKIRTIPLLSSASLQYVSFMHNLITDLNPDVFTHLPVVAKVDLSSNHLTEIPKGTFTGLPHLGIVRLEGNNISRLHSHTFELVSSPSTNPFLQLENNIVSFVDVDTFKDVAENGNIRMVNNALTQLPEVVWRPVLERKIIVQLLGNALECGCDVAWLVRNPQLMTMTVGGRCADGTLLTDLHPADFDACS